MHFCTVIVIVVGLGSVFLAEGVGSRTGPRKHGLDEALALSAVPMTVCTAHTTKPIRCKCVTVNSTDLLVNCSGQQLIAVPSDIPVATTTLILSNNSIGNISKSPFSNLVNLKHLDLSANIITEFRIGSFHGLANLLSLDLHDNNFKLTPTSFDDRVFEPLRNLKELNIKSNLYAEDLNYPDNSLQYLSGLNTLRITGLSNTTFGHGVRNMTSLRTLDLSNSKEFKYIYRETFTNFKDIPLHTLLLNASTLKWIDMDAFVYLPRIDTIDFSRNIFLEIGGVGKTFKGLQNTSIRKVIMRHVHTSIDYTTLTVDDVKYMNLTRLEEVYMDNNTIIQFETKVIFYLPKPLKILSMSYNSIQTTKAQIMALMVLQNLTQLNIGYQQFYNPTANKEKDASHQLPPSSTSSLNGMDTSTFFESPDVNGISIGFPPKLWKIQCSNTYKLRYPIPALTLLGASVTYADFSNNLLSQWKGPIQGVETMKYLDLSGNECYDVSDNFFNTVPNLETLLIGNNKLGSDISENLFFNLTLLKTLDMSTNNMEYTKPGLFSDLRSLRTLDMSNNYLASWEANVSGLVNLRMLNLASNKFTSLPENLRTDLDTLNTITHLQVDISSNPFLCDCNTGDFVSWMAKSKIQFLNINSTLCKLDNGTRLSLIYGDHINQYLQTHCRSYTVIISVLSSVFGLSIVVLTGVLIRKNRWRIRYWFYMKFNRRERTGYQRLEGNDVENAFFFDAFISYEENSREFLLREIIPRLETEANLNLCIDKRNFVPGLYVEDNIMNAIQNSRKTVVLLTNEFLKSKWCMYELNMARMEGIHTDRQNLIVVLMEEICTENYSREVLDVFRRHTYIERTEDGYGSQLYWKRLIDSINEDRPYPLCIN